MSMATDDERREVAHNIRENYVCDGMGYKAATAYNIAMAIGMNPGVLVGDIELWNRLADLIEPPLQCPYYHSDRHRCSAYDDVVDRDALLALAEDVADSAAMATVMDASEGSEMLAEMLLDIARRIREACGEVVG